MIMIIVYFHIGIIIYVHSAGLLGPLLKLRPHNHHNHNHHHHHHYHRHHCHHHLLPNQHHHLSVLQDYLVRKLTSGVPRSLATTPTLETAGLDDSDDDDDDGESDHILDDDYNYYV